MTGTKNFHVLLWITGAYLFTSSSLGLAHDEATQTQFLVEAQQGSSHLFQNSSHSSPKQTLMRSHDGTEMRDICYTKWRMEERTLAYTIKKRVPHTEYRSKKYTVMIPENRTKTVQCTTEHFPSNQRHVNPVRIPNQEQFDKQYTVMIPVQQERTTSWTVKVPFKKTFEEMFIVMVPVEEKKTEEYTVRIPFLEKVHETYTVKVPYQEKIITYRKVTKRVPVKTTKTVVCHGGHWGMEAQKVSENSRCDPAGDPGVPETIYRRKWVPTSVTREVPATIWKCIIEEVPHISYVQKYRSEERTRTQYVQRYRKETKIRESFITKMVPEKRTRIVSIETFREEKRTGTYCVTKMVPEKRTKPAHFTQYRWETRTPEQTLQKNVPKIQTKTVRYTVMVPKEKICTYRVLGHDTVTEKKTLRYYVRVPYSVSKKVPLTVRRCFVKQAQDDVTSQSGKVHSSDSENTKKSA